MGRAGALFLGTCTLATLSAGCSFSAVRPPSFSPGAISREAMSQLDSNTNGQLEATELAKSPGLLAALKQADSDGNGTLSQSEIAGRIEAYRSSQIGLMPFTCTVYLDRQPLAGAKVKLIPEPFLATTIKPAAGETSEAGIAAPMIEGETTPAVQCGMYRVEISKPDSGGAETLAARYNTATELGQDIAPDVAGLERGVAFLLTTK
jgi:hypothetical protein